MLFENKAKVIRLDAERTEESICRLAVGLVYQVIDIDAPLACVAAANHKIRHALRVNFAQKGHFQFEWRN